MNEATKFVSTGDHVLNLIAITRTPHPCVLFTFQIKMISQNINTNDDHSAVQKRYNVSTTVRENYMDSTSECCCLICF